MEETIRGLHVKDYTDLEPNALQEIIELDNQLVEELKKYLQYVDELDYTKLRTNLKWLIEDNISHRDYTQKCLDDVLVRMEGQEATKHFEDYMNPPTRPCKHQNCEEVQICPYDTEGEKFPREICIHRRGKTNE